MLLLTSNLHLSRPLWCEICCRTPFETPPLVEDRRCHANWLQIGGRCWRFGGSRVTIVTPEFDEAVTASDFDKFGPRNGQFSMAKNVAPSFRGGQQVREFADDVLNFRVRGSKLGASRCPFLRHRIAEAKPTRLGRCLARVVREPLFSPDGGYYFDRPLLRKRCVLFARLS